MPRTPSPYLWLTHTYKLNQPFKHLPEGATVALVGRLDNWYVRKVAPTKRYQTHWRFGSKALKADWEKLDINITEVTQLLDVIRSNRKD